MKYETRAALISAVISTSAVGLLHGLQREYKHSHEHGNRLRWDYFEKG